MAKAHTATELPPGELHYTDNITRMLRNFTLNVQSEF